MVKLYYRRKDSGVSEVVFPQTSVAWSRDYEVMLARTLARHSEHHHFQGLWDVKKGTHI